MLAEFGRQLEPVGEISKAEAIPITICNTIAAVQTVGKDTPTYILMTGSFNPVHRYHIEIMMAAKAQLTKLGYYVVGGFMSMNCTGGTDSDQLYSLLTLACSLTRDGKG